MGIPVIDVDGDGIPELFITSKTEVGMYTYLGKKWSKTMPGTTLVNGPGIVGDFNNDGRYEIFCPSDGAYFYLLDAITGAEKWKLYVGPLPSDFSCVGRYGVSCGDVDNDGFVELIGGVGGGPQANSPHANSVIVFKG